MPADIAATVEIHETVPPTASSDTTMGMGGADTSDTTTGGHGADDHAARRLGGLPAGETVALETGGFHIMLIDPSPLETGQRSR